MSKNAKQQLAQIQERRENQHTLELRQWMYQSWFGTRRRAAIEPIIKQLQYPTFWVGKHVYFTELPPDRQHPFTIRHCKATTKGITAVWHNKRYILEVRDHRLYFPAFKEHE